MWLNQVGIRQRLLEQVHLREEVSAALQAVRGEELAVVASGRLVEVLVLNRLMAPRPVYRVGEWRHGRVLAHRLGLDPAQVNDARLGRLLDALDGVTATIWPQLVAHAHAHALAVGGADLAALYYDSTSFSFAGDDVDVPAIPSGYSRDRRPDTQQVEVGLTVTVTAPDGLPVAYRVLAGNTADATTPVDNLHLLQRLVAHVAADAPFPLVISDRALLSLATRAAYEAAGVRYLGPLPDSALTSALLERAAATDWAAHPLAYRPAREQRTRPAPPAQGAAVDGAAGALETETEAEEGVYYGVRLSVDLPLPAVGATPARTLTRPALVVKRTRQALLDATHRQTLLTRLETSLSDLASKLKRGRYCRQAAVEARRATLLAAAGTARLRRFLSVQVSGTDGQVRLQVERDAPALAQAATRDGLYVLLTNAEGLDNEAMLTQTKGRDRIEKRIALFKGPLAVRPMFLEKVERIRAMVFICLVALLVYSLLEQRARQAGLRVTGRKVLERLAVCSAVLTTFADGTTLLLAAPFSAWQQELAVPLTVPDPNHWLVPLDPLPS